MRRCLPLVPNLYLIALLISRVNRFSTSSIVLEKVTIINDLRDGKILDI